MNVIIYILRLLLSLTFVYFIIFINVLLIGTSLVAGMDWYYGYFVTFFILVASLQTLLGIQ